MGRCFRPATGIPTVTSINGFPLAATSSDPSYAVNNVETLIVPGSGVIMGGSGFDAVDGVAVNVFGAAGNAGPIFVKPGSGGLSPTSLNFTLPVGVPTGPGSLVVINKGSDAKYSKSSNAVSVPIGAVLTVSSVTQSGCTVTVNGAGFAVTPPGRPPVTVINLFDSQPGGVVNIAAWQPAASR